MADEVIRIGPPAHAHACAALQCKEIIPSKMLMCGRHWRLVPRDIQSRVWAAYREGQEKCGPISDVYWVAMQNAISAVADKEKIIHEILKG